MLAPAPTILDTYADLADVVEGRVPIERVPYRLWATLSDDDQGAALAARRRAEDDAGKLDYFRERHGIDLRDRSTILDLAERMARAEAEFAYYTGAEPATGDSRGPVTADSGRPAGSLDTGQQFGISDPGARAKVDRVPPGQASRRIERHRRYDRAKADQVPMIRAGADAIEGAVREIDDYSTIRRSADAAFLDQLADRVDECRRVKVYRDAVCGRSMGRPTSCHVRTCPDCERARSARLVRRLEVAAGRAERGALVTLTTPNVPLGELARGLAIIREALTALRGRALFAGGPCRSGEHGDPADRTAAPARCKHPPHRKDRARAGTCQCARCTVAGADRDGVPGLDAGPCRSWVPLGDGRRRRCGLVAEDHVGRDQRAGADLGAAPPDSGRKLDPDQVGVGVAVAEGMPLDRDDSAGQPGEGESVDLPPAHPIPDPPAHAGTIDHPYRSGRRRGCRRCWHVAVKGGVHAEEVTFRPDRGEWHPHVHMLVDGPFLLWSELRESWRAVTCDAIRRSERPAPVDGGRPAPLPRCRHRSDAEYRSTGGCRGASIVDIRGLQGDPGSPERRAAIRETVKYVTKGILGRDGELAPALRPVDLAELLLALRRRRLVNGWGTFRGVTDDPDDSDDGVARLSGPDVPIELRGLPVACPFCAAPAAWEYLFDAARGACTPLDGGILVWHPPPVTHGPT